MARSLWSLLPPFGRHPDQHLDLPVIEAEAE
jgi:hypothetical protein